MKEISHADKIKIIRLILDLHSTIILNSFVLLPIKEVDKLFAKLMIEISLNIDMSFEDVQEARNVNSEFKGIQTVLTSLQELLNSIFEPSDQVLIDITSTIEEIKSHY